MTGRALDRLAGVRPLRAAAVLLLTAAVGFAAPVAQADVYVYEDGRGGIWFTDNPPHTGFKPYGHKKGAGTLTRATLHASHRPGSRSADRAGSTRPVLDPMIRRASRAHGISPALVKAVIHAESGFDPRAVSHKGAQGLMQLMPQTSRQLGVRDPFDAWQNVDGGTRHLSYLVTRYEGDLALALAAYNAGGQAVERYGGIPPYPETRQYVRKVLDLYRRYHADFR
jgi:hypothetical protein